MMKIQHTLFLVTLLISVFLTIDISRGEDTAPVPGTEKLSCPFLFEEQCGLDGKAKFYKGKTCAEVLSMSNRECVQEMESCNRYLGERLKCGKTTTQQNKCFAPQVKPSAGSIANSENCVSITIPDDPNNLDPKKPYRKNEETGVYEEGAMYIPTRVDCSIECRLKEEPKDSSANY
jgi:hypothetical protein